MIDNKDNGIEITINIENEIGDEPVNIDYQGENEETQDSSADDLKQQAGQLFRAAGNLAGSVGKLALKKGSEIKGKLEDEEFRDKTSTTVKSLSNKAAKVASSAASSASTLAKKTVTKSSKTSNSESMSKNNEESCEKEEGSFTGSVEKKPPKGIRSSIEKRKLENAEIKTVENELNDEDIKKIFKIIALVVVVGFVSLGIFGLLDKLWHGGQIHPPFSSEDLSGLNYEEVVKAFKDRGFTDVTTRKIEDLISGILVSDGEVENVRIGEKDEYSTGSWFEPDSKVVVSYHTFPAKTSNRPSNSYSSTSPSNNSSNSTKDDKESNYFSSKMTDMDCVMDSKHPLFIDYLDDENLKWIGAINERQEDKNLEYGFITFDSNRDQDNEYYIGDINILLSIMDLNPIKTVDEGFELAKEYLNIKKMRELYRYRTSFRYEAGESVYYQIDYTAKDIDDYQYSLTFQVTVEEKEDGSIESVRLSTNHWISSWWDGIDESWNKDILTE